MVDISSITGQTVNNSQSSAASKSLSADMNTFLKLLTTQLQYQDPLEPMDTAAFTQQLVQYSAVEQQIQTNSKLEKLLTLNTSNLAAQAVSYIGKVVQVLGDVMPLENGVAKATYTLDKNVTSAMVVVKDMKGNVVYSEKGNITTGTHDFKWNGKDKNGNQLEDGAYQISVTTNVGTGETAANVMTTIFGKVTGIAGDENNIYVGLGDAVTSQLGDILTIREDKYFDKKEEVKTPVENGSDTGGDDTTVDA